ncbi:hypothetical protein BH10PSE18_BH10PSE18_04180 [soil metagenome]
MAQHQAIAARLASSPFGRPVVLDSLELPDGLKGDVYAIVDHPLRKMEEALRTPGRWCEALLLHLNNRRCQVAEEQGRAMLTLSVVGRYDKPVDSAFMLPFVFRMLSATPDYMAVQMSAEEGPFGTSNYYVMLEAIPVDAGRTFLHFSYAYDHNLMARIATQAYLATFGRDKVGFTALGTLPGGETDWIRGTRGLVERNAMRYFLAVDAYLSAIDAPAAQQVEDRLQAWFSSVEKYPRQLHEIDRATYLDLKREDRLRDGPR